jgi:hypothetical protein
MMRDWVVLAALFAGVAGCASTPQATVARDTEAKTFPSHPATAALYIFRPDNAAEDSVLWVDNRLIGATLPGAYFVVHVKPGRHVLSGLAADNGRLMLESRPGEVVFVALRVTGGQSRFERVLLEMGRKTLLNCCALLENWAPGQRPLLR